MKEGGREDNIEEARKCEGEGRREKWREESIWGGKIGRGKKEGDIGQTKGRRKNRRKK